ncbi:MAG: ABC transporter ATP-binding protein [Lachnospiraceae bacterium]|nr:ABC transporter ATP-binding protein [Lachnospiraceae bacterium]
MKNAKIKGLIQFFSFFEIKKKRMVLIGFLLLVVTTITLIQPKLWASILNGIFVGKPVLYIFGCTILFFVSQIAEIIVSYIQNICVQKTQLHLIKNIRLYMIDKVMNMSALEFIAKDKGELISRLDSDTDEIANGIVSEMINLVFTIIKVVVIVVMLVWTSVWLSIIVIFFQFIAYFFIHNSERSIKQATKEFSRVSDEVVSNIEMVIRGLLEIRNLGLKEKAIEKTDTILEKKKSIQLDYIKAHMNYQNKAIILNNFFQFVVLLIGIYFISYNLLSFYDFVSFSSYSSIFAASITALYGAKANYINCFNSLSRFYELVGSLDEGKNDLEFDTEMKTSAVVDTYKLIGLTFSYGEKIVFSNINVCFYKGKINYVVGNSGCGKTTLLMVIMGFYKEIEGQRLINECIINNDELPKTIMAGQDPFFFDETILFNLQAVNSKKTESEIEAACRKANILEEILNFPEGFHTRLTNNATNISYGQRQRLAIARILLLDCDILLCDEILSNVDYDSKNKIIKSLRLIAKEKIVIFVTHDSGLIQENDNIYNMSNQG